MPRDKGLSTGLSSPPDTGGNRRRSNARYACMHNRAGIEMLATGPKKPATPLVKMAVAKAAARQFNEDA